MCVSLMPLHQEWWINMTAVLYDKVKMHFGTNSDMRNNSASWEQVAEGSQPFFLQARSNRTSHCNWWWTYHAIRVKIEVWMKLNRVVVTGYGLYLNWEYARERRIFGQFKEWKDWDWWNLDLIDVHNAAEINDTTKIFCRLPIVSMTILYAHAAQTVDHANLDTSTW